MEQKDELDIADLLFIQIFVMDSTKVPVADTEVDIPANEKDGLKPVILDCCSGSGLETGATTVFKVRCEVASCWML